MAVSTTNIQRYMFPANLYVFMDKPADLANMAHTGGIPDGAHTYHVGATTGEAVFEYRPTIATVDIEQAFGGVAPHMTAESATIRATLSEAVWRNVEIAMSQAYMRNLLPESSFETDGNSDGLADHWTSTGVITPTLSATVPASSPGVKSQQFVTGAAAGGIVSDVVNHQTLVGGQTVVLSFQAEAVGGTPNLTSVIEAFDASAVSVGTDTAVHALANGTYGPFNHAWALPSNTMSVQVTLTDATGQTATIRVDDVQLEVGSTPTTYTMERTMSVGGRTSCNPFTAAIVGLESDRAKYVWAMLYNAYSGEGLAKRFKKGEPGTLPLTLTGLPDTNRTAGDQLAQYVEEV